jgi:hypothetical protein
MPAPQLQKQRKPAYALGKERNDQAGSVTQWLQASNL